MQPACRTPLAVLRLVSCFESGSVASHWLQRQSVFLAHRRRVQSPISGGREVRVFVENGQVNDEQTIMLSRDIARKIEDEMSYPGTIKVTVVRETKAVGVAK